MEGASHMDIRSSLEGLKSIFGAAPAPPAASQTKPGSQTGAPATAGDRATLSSAGSEVAQTASDSDVRWDKVASIQAQLAAGTYNVPASAVASKLVESLLS
jgi:negative regulator of flagellin synthesis FlgM